MVLLHHHYKESPSVPKPCTTTFNFPRKKRTSTSRWSCGLSHSREWKTLRYVLPFIVIPSNRWKRREQDKGSEREKKVLQSEDVTTRFWWCHPTLSTQHATGRPSISSFVSASLRKRLRLQQSVQVTSQTSKISLMTHSCLHLQSIWRIIALSDRRGPLPLRTHKKDVIAMQKKKNEL